MEGSELYFCIPIERLKSLARGTLSAQKDSVTGLNFAEDWSLDPTGNWSTYKQDEDGDGTWDLDQSRTHNPANEITQIAASSTHVAHDRCGNMTRIPKPDDWNAHFDLTYDPWNRLVRVEGAGLTVAEYAYDARDCRAVIITYDSGQPDESRHIYHDAGARSIEERAGSSANPDRHLVWGMLHIKQVVLRDRDASEPRDGSLDERLYATQEPNWSAAALADCGGAVQERYSYNSHGNSTLLTMSFGSASSSTFAWEHRAVNRRLDLKTRIEHDASRYASAALGRYLGNTATFALGPTMRRRRSLTPGPNGPVCVPPTPEPGLPPDPTSQPGLPVCEECRPEDTCIPRPLTPAAPPEVFYVCWRPTRYGYGWKRLWSWLCGCNHADIYGEQSGLIYKGWEGPQDPLVAGSGLPQGAEWKCVELHRATSLVYSVGTGAPGSVVHMEIEWGPKKGVSCQFATTADILACLRAKPSPPPGHTPNIVFNCQTDVFEAITGCCLKGFYPLSLIQPWPIAF